MRTFFDRFRHFSTSACVAAGPGTEFENVPRLDLPEDADRVTCGGRRLLAVHARMGRVGALPVAPLRIREVLPVIHHVRLPSTPTRPRRHRQLHSLLPLDDRAHSDGPVTAAVVSATVSARNRLAQGEKVVYDLGTGGLAYSTVTSSPGGPAWW